MEHQFAEKFDWKNQQGYKNKFGNDKSIMSASLE